MALKIKRAHTVRNLYTDLSARAAWEIASVDFERLKHESNAGMEVNPDRLAAARRVREAEEAMQNSVVEFTLEAIPRKEYEEWQESNPPRSGNEIDERYGADFRGFNDLITKSITKAVEIGTGEVYADPKAVWREYSEEISAAQFGEFADDAWFVNQKVAGAPFSQAALQETLR